MREADEQSLPMSSVISKKLKSVWEAFIDKDKDVRDDTLIQKLLDYLRYAITIQKNLDIITSLCQDPTLKKFVTASVGSSLRNHIAQVGYRITGFLIDECYKDSVWQENLRLLLESGWKSDDDLIKIAVVLTLSDASSSKNVIEYLIKKETIYLDELFSSFLSTNYHLANAVRKCILSMISTCLQKPTSKLRHSLLSSIISRFKNSESILISKNFSNLLNDAIKDPILTETLASKGIFSQLIKLAPQLTTDFICILADIKKSLTADDLNLLINIPKDCQAKGNISVSLAILDFVVKFDKCSTLTDYLTADLLAPVIIFVSGKKNESECWMDVINDENRSQTIMLELLGRLENNMIIVSENCQLFQLFTEKLFFCTANDKKDFYTKVLSESVRVRSSILRLLLAVAQSEKNFYEISFRIASGSNFSAQEQELSLRIAALSCSNTRQASKLFDLIESCLSRMHSQVRDEAINSLNILVNEDLLTEEHYDRAIQQSSTKDADSYVRASLVGCLLNMLVKRKLKDNQMRKVFDDVQTLIIEDDEAIPRRAAVKGLTEVIKNSKEGDEWYIRMVLDSAKRCLKDQDWEVRKNLVYLLKEAFQAETVASSLLKEADAHIVLMSLANDIETTVRGAALDLLQSVYPSSNDLPSYAQPVKEDVIPLDDFVTKPVSLLDDILADMEVDIDCY
ncbi:DgyrCDS8277 [Dimorphilus gyrociliatus]|uniref:DgyrCDS8277 n=1 Tax=Dimorphilus gyrociliatus TaxID=2664684 RepID=A0A7I8VVW2_9ANNE|nr:DgyrCDS8277 [Dimorphilus gyrociliatus]